MPGGNRLKKFQGYFSPKQSTKLENVEESRSQQENSSELDPAQLQTGSEPDSPQVTPREQKRRSYWPGASPKSQQTERSADRPGQEIVPRKGLQGGSIQGTVATDQILTRDGQTLQLSVEKSLPEVPQQDTQLGFSDSLELAIQCPDSPASVESEKIFKSELSYPGRFQSGITIPR